MLPLPRVFTTWVCHCLWLQRFSPPPPPELLQAIQLSVKAHRRGGLDPRGLDALLLIADELEISHGWDPLLVDGWLDRLGFWDGEF
jgi:hypothetical protein